jgi:phosphohistidine phosphatase
MERNLFIIRHGKSSWDHEGLDDMDRPLANRGIRNAEDMAGRLTRLGMVPELILTSPANRALTTARIMSGLWGLEPAALQIREMLYMSYASEIDEVVSTVPSHIRNLAIFGHNPAFTLYANQFLEEPLDNLPTAGVVIITLDSEQWGEIRTAKIVKVYVDFPKRPQQGV